MDGKKIHIRWVEAACRSLEVEVSEVEAALVIEGFVNDEHWMCYITGSPVLEDRREVVSFFLSEQVSSRGWDVLADCRVLFQ